MTEPLVGIQDRALATLLELADDVTIDGIARVIAAERVLEEAKTRAKQERKQAKKRKNKKEP